MLQIGLAIEIFSFDVAYSLSPRRVQKNKISREELIIETLDYVTNPDFFPWLRLKLSSLRVKHECFTVVFLIISSMPFNIFK